jgi:hypothetical protein
VHASYAKVAATHQVAANPSLISSESPSILSAGFRFWCQHSSIPQKALSHTYLSE